MDFQAILAVVLCLVLNNQEVESSSSPPCLSNQYEEKGFCCNKCRPGTFVLTQCNKTAQSVCQPCKEGTFSSNWTFRNECAVCGNDHCQPTMGLTHICNSTVDNKCGCLNPGKFHHVATDSCRICQRCSPGSYPFRPCTEETRCVPCPENYFTNKSSINGLCMKCTECNHYEKICSPTHDAVCRREAISVPTTQQLEGFIFSKPTSTETAMSNSSKENSVIIVMVALVCVLIVVIMMARMICWRRKKGFNNINDAGGRAFSFGGVLLRYQPATVILGLHQMLNPEAPNNWRKLATVLDVPYILIRNYEVTPARAAENMLHAWGTSDESTIDKLYNCLEKIGRQDVCTFLEENVETGREETAV